MDGARYVAPGEIHKNDCYCDIPKMCGGVWWLNFHSLAENITKKGCPTCGREAERMVNAMHDAVNAKMGAPVKHPADLRFMRDLLDRALAKAGGAERPRLARVADPALAAAAARLPFGHAERVYAIYTDAHGRPMESSCVSACGIVGDVRTAPVPVGRIIAEAKRLGARGLALVHNHPSGARGPSAEDVDASHTLAREATRHGLTFRDHLVVTRDGVTSILGASA